MLDLLEVSVEPGFQLRQRQVRGVATVELCERQTKLGAKLFQSKFRKTRLAEDIICCLPNGGQVVYQSPRPVKDNIPNHVCTLAINVRVSSVEFGATFSGETIYARENKKYHLLPAIGDPILRALFERKLTFMRRPKGIKTKKSVAKRFKITATGKVMRMRAGKRHLLQGKSPKRRRSLGTSKLVNTTDVYRIKQNLPFSH